MNDRSYEETEDTPIDRPMDKPLAAIWQSRMNRRGFLKSSTSAMTIATAGLALPISLTACSNQLPSFDFVEIEHGVDDTHHVAPDHEADILIRWGDPVTPDAPVFDQ